MSNVIQLTVPSRILPLEARVTALLGCFGDHRRGPDDVFWLKENAELLNILEVTGTPVAPEALAQHAEFYTQVEKRLRFFPQYYRFLLSLALDLEDLGMPGDVAERMVAFAARDGLAEAELSDLQRAEARRLMARRGHQPAGCDGLDDRLHAFVDRSATFALPNKKAAYELTHIAFYLSEYGRRDPGLSREARQSLHFAGLTAFLDQNADLLSEVCVALRYAGEAPPPVWTAWLQGETRGFVVNDAAGAPLGDHYHAYFVCNWHEAVAGGEIFRSALPGQSLRFVQGARRQTALRELSRVMLDLDQARSPDFDVMWHRMEGHLSDEARGMLAAAADSTAHFGDFFEGFARAGQI